MYSTSPVFEGMPPLALEDKQTGWATISKDILSHYAPHIPYKYFKERQGDLYKNVP